MTQINLDDLDHKIIDMLGRDARVSNRQIAADLGVTEGTIRAAATVPECHAPWPRFVPRLMPDSTTSTLSHWNMPSATQSAGVPSTRYASISMGSSVDR